MYSWLWLLWLFTCWSWGPGARWCGPLGLCRALRGHNPLMSVAPRSCPSSSETGTWYQSCRCQKTLDLKAERLFVLLVSGFGKAIFWSPKGERRPPPSSKCKGLGSARRAAPPCFLRGFQCCAHSSGTPVGWMFALTEPFQLKNSFPVTLQLVFPLSLIQNALLTRASLFFLSWTKRSGWHDPSSCQPINREISLFIWRGKANPDILSENLHNNRTIIFINILYQTFQCFFLQQLFKNSLMAKRAPS